ncbi:MAG: DUF2231 domain-containing protein, partial [Thermoanaerobaculales bacterium]
MSLLPDPLHPAIVHFPIALSMVALLFELIARHPRARSMGTAAGVLLVLAAIGSVVAVLTGNAALGAEIIVYDGTGRHPAPQFAELAASEGRQVSLVSIDAQLAMELTYAERAIWKKRAYELAIPMTF